MVFPTTEAGLQADGQTCFLAVLLDKDGGVVVVLRVMAEGTQDTDQTHFLQAAPEVEEEEVEVRQARVEALVASAVQEQKWVEVLVVPLVLAMESVVVVIFLAEVGVVTMAIEMVDLLLDNRMEDMDSTPMDGHRAVLASVRTALALLLEFPALGLALALGTLR